MKTDLTRTHFVPRLRNAAWTVGMLALFIISLPIVIVLGLKDFVEEIDYIFFRMGGRY